MEDNITFISCLKFKHVVVINCNYIINLKLYHHILFKVFTLIYYAFHIFVLFNLHIFMHIYQFYKYTIALYVYPNRNILLHYNILTPVLLFNSLINSSFFIQSPKFLIITTGLFRFISPILQYTFLSPIILLKHIKHYLPT